MDAWRKLPEAHFDSLCTRLPATHNLADVLAALHGAAWCAVMGAGAAPFVREQAGCITLGLEAEGRVQVAPVRSWCAELRKQDASPARQLVVDNSLAGPYLCRPLAAGADVAVEDLRFWLGTGGVAVYARTRQQGEAFCAKVETEEFVEIVSSSSSDVAQAVAPGEPREAGPRHSACADTLSTCTPFERALLASASSRAQRRCDAALVAASYLAAHPRVAWVSYPGLAGDAAQESAHGTLDHGAGPLVSFGLAEGLDAASVCARAAEQPCLDACAPADAPSCDRTCLWSPASGVVALSLGLETPLDIVLSLEACLEAAPSLG